MTGTCFGTCRNSRKIAAIELPFLRHPRLQLPQLVRLRQPPKPQQVADLLKRRVVREFMNVVPAISEHARFAIDVTNARSGRDDPFQAPSVQQLETVDIILTNQS